MEETRIAMVKTSKDAHGPSGSDLRTDILLVTVTTVEAEAVLHVFIGEHAQPLHRHFIGNNVYIDLGIFAGARIMMVQSEMGAVGPGGSLLVVDEGIRKLSPSAVIMVGIAFGFAEKQLKIGAILVSQQLFGYELQKVATTEIGQQKIISRGDRPQASPRLLSHFRSGKLDWQEAQVEFGLLLSGDKLIDNQDFREQVRTFAPEALGGEMEGIGLYSAAQLRKVDWIVVKAVCDWADGHKAQNKDAHQKLAAENAARFTLHVCQLGGFVDTSQQRDATEEVSRPLSAILRSNRNLAFVPERGALLYRYNEHAGWVLAVAWEPEGTRIASAGADGTVRIWEATTGQSLLTYHGHTRLLNKVSIQAKIYTLAWSPERLRVASAGSGANVYVWNATTGQTLARYQNHSRIAPAVYAVSWSPASEQIASACSSSGYDKTIHIWDAVSEQTLKRYDARYGWLPDFTVLSLAWSSNGTYLAASCMDKSIRIWDTAIGRLVATYRFRSASASHIAWSPDNRYLASALPDHTAQIWDTRTERVVKIYRGHTDSVRYVAWSPDGASIASAANDRTVHIWEPLTGKHMYTYQGHSDWVTSVSWSPDSSCIASTSNDKTVQIWQVES